MEFKTISTLLCCVFVNIKHSGGSKGDARDACSHPGPNLCSFWENLAKSCVGAPGELASPPRGNPGSATETS